MNVTKITSVTKMLPKCEGGRDYEIWRKDCLGNIYFKMVPKFYLIINSNTCFNKC